MFTAFAEHLCRIINYKVLDNASRFYDSVTEGGQQQLNEDVFDDLHEDSDPHVDLQLLETFVFLDTAPESSAHERNDHRLP
jgi:hypothetical protein